MKISFELTIDDWMEFQKYYLSISKQFQRAKTIIIIMIPSMLIIPLLFDYSRGEFSYFNLISFFVFSILGILFIPRLSEKYSLLSARKMLDEGDNSALLGNHEIEFTGDYFFVKEPGSECKIKWSAINKIEENEKYIFIFITSVTAYIIPKFKITDGKEKVFQFIRSKNIK